MPKPWETAFKRHNALINKELGIMPIGSRYVPFTLETFSALMTEIGFTRAAQPNTFEAVFERQVELSDGRDEPHWNKYPFKVRIYSTCELRGDTGARGCGEDAIRIDLIDIERDRPIKGITAKVLRTKNAFPKLKEHAREMFRFVGEHNCRRCNKGVLVRRKGGNGDFRGCSNFPLCTATEEL